MSNYISFIVPVRERRDHLPGFLFNIKKYYKNYEIILACQDDNLLFRKGQLSNLGYKKAKYDILAFINLDYRFLSYVDLAYELKNSDGPICPFSHQARVVENTIGNLEIVRKPLYTDNCGGCTVFTREQWIKSCGNSNLMIGWGPDDNLLYYRTNFKKLKDISMGHIVHGKSGPYFKKSIKLRNQRIKMKDPNKDRTQDGFNQTLADETGKIIHEKNAIEYKFTNIRVPKDFKYMKQYKEGIELEKKVLGL